MKRLFLLTIALLGLFTACKKDKIAPSNQGDAFIKYYGHVRDQTASDIKKTADGGFILLGSSNSYSTSSFNDYFLVKTDSLGNEMWSRTFGDGGIGFEEEGISVVVLANDEGYLVAGNRQEVVLLGGDPSAQGETKIVLYKIDLDGVVVWEKVLRESTAQSYSDLIADIKQMPSGGFVLVGQTTNVTPKSESTQYGIYDKWDILYMTLDADGNSINQAIRGYIGEDVGVAVEIVDNAFIIIGRESPRQGGTPQSPIFGKLILCGRFNANSLGETWVENFRDIEDLYPDIKLETAYSCLDTSNLSGTTIITIIAHVEANPLSVGAKDGDLLVVKIPETGTWNSSDMTFLGKNSGTAGVSGNLQAASIALVPAELQNQDPSFILTATHSIGSSGSECMLLRLNYDLTPHADWLDKARFFGSSSIGGQWAVGNRAKKVLPLERVVSGTTRSELTGYAFTGTFDLGTNTMIGLVKTNKIGTLTPEAE